MDYKKKPITSTMRASVCFVTFLVSGLFSVSSCTQRSDDLRPISLYQSDFSRNNDGWAADYTDYSAVTEDVRFESAHAGLPQPLDGNRKCILMSSINRSDDVFMFLTKKLTGLQPNRDYRLVFDVELASIYATNSYGVGGSPGSSVFLKAGAATVEPKKQLNGDFYELNIDKGIQSVGGRDAVVLGNIDAGNDVTEYKLITRSNADAPFTARTNANGELWLIVGTDSGYEGETKLYYSNISVSVKQ